jgi:ubiquinol-cytochrome c reductase cytochrome b subunit
VNNLVFKDVGMPHVLFELQGETVCKPGWARDSHGRIMKDPLTGFNLEADHSGEHASACGRVEKVAGTGTMSTEEYDQAMYDLVNFLEYMGEPMQLERKRIGVYVLAFIAFFFIFVLLLNREYWKNIH